MVMMWCCLCADGTGSLCFGERNVDGLIYRDIVDFNLIGQEMETGEKTMTPNIQPEILGDFEFASPSEEFF